MYRFSAGFPYKLVNSLLLNEKAELLPVAQKKLLSPTTLCVLLVHISSMYRPGSDTIVGNAVIKKSYNHARSI